MSSLNSVESEVSDVQCDWSSRTVKRCAWCASAHLFGMYFAVVRLDLTDVNYVTDPIPWKKSTAVRNKESGPVDKTEAVTLSEREVRLKGHDLRNEVKDRRKFEKHFFRISESRMMMKVGNDELSVIYLILIEEDIQSSIWRESWSVRVVEFLFWDELMTWRCTSHASSDWRFNLGSGRHIAFQSSAQLLSRCVEFPSDESLNKRCAQEWSGVGGN